MGKSVKLGMFIFLFAGTRRCPAPWGAEPGAGSSLIAIRVGALVHLLMHHKCSHWCIFTQSTWVKGLKPLRVQNGYPWFGHMWFTALLCVKGHVLGPSKSPKYFRQHLQQVIIRQSQPLYIAQAKSTCVIHSRVSRPFITLNCGVPSTRSLKCGPVSAF